MNKLVIIGAGGHGKVIADIALKNGYSQICFVDDNGASDCMGFPIVGKVSSLSVLNNETTDFVIGIGNNAIRKRLSESFQLNWTTLVHPSAQIGTNVKIGKGTVIMACAVVNSCASIGEHCIINSSSVVEHDNIIENYVHISPGAKLGGTVKIGENTHIGIGSTVKNNIEICGGCIVGAGAVVVKNIETSGIYIGVPANRR